MGRFRVIAGGIQIVRYFLVTAFLLVRLWFVCGRGLMCRCVGLLICSFVSLWLRHYLWHWIYITKNMKQTSKCMMEILALTALLLTIQNTNDI